MLPEIMKNATTPEAGAKILENIGMDKRFIHDTFNKYSKYASMVPGLNPDSAKSVLGRITGAMSERESAAPEKSKAENTLFNKNKYPRV